MEHEYPKLIIHKNGGLTFDGSPVPMDTVNYADFMIAALDSTVELEGGMLIAELIHALYPLKDFIKNYNAEDYEVIRSYMTLNKLQKNYGYISINKAIVIEDGYLETVVRAELIPDTDGTNKLSDIPVVITEDSVLNHEEIKLEIKTRIKLFDVMTALFEDLSNQLTNKLIMTT